jgi:hypothetical protein
MYRAWDECGNTASCVQEITVQDDIAPELTCEDIEVACTEKSCLTFDDVTVNSFAAPVVVSSFNVDGVTVDITAWRKGGIQGDAVLYNTSAPHPADPDLGTPNTLYGGPGVNNADPNGYNHSNNQGVGNAIIVQTPGSAFPDDNLLSDSLVFTFSEPVFMESFVGVDFELSQVLTGAGIFLYDENGASLGFTPFSAVIAENNSLEEVSLRMNGVKKLKVYYGTTVPSSGGVAKLCFVHVPDPESYDACSEVEIHTEETMTFINDCTTEIERTFDAVDACGNETQDECVQTITIHTDSHQPDIICPADISLGCDDPVPPANVNAVVVTDDCSDAADITVEWVQDISTGTGCNQVIRRIYKATDECGNNALCVQFITREPQVRLTAKAFLSGPYSGPSTMTTALNGLLNSSQNNHPYSGPPYSHTGTEYVAVFPPNIVDWVYVELRNSANSALVIESRAALLTSSGNIVDLDGTSPVTFSAPPAFYYVAVHHRNHLDVLSSATVNMTSGMGTLDLSTQVSGQVLVAGGIRAMVKGDVNVDHLVNNTDLVALAPQAAIGFAGVYSLFDVNMDGLINNSDLVALAPFAAIGFARNF